MEVKSIFFFNIKILLKLSYQTFIYELKCKTTVSISVMNKINCYHSLLNEVMLKKSPIFIGNLFIEKKNMHLPYNELENGPWNGH